MSTEKTLYLVDGTYLFFRAWHSLPPSMAVFGEPYKRSRPGLAEILREGAGTAREPEGIAAEALAWLEDPTRDRLPTSAVRGLTSVLVKIVRELRPAYMGVAFDLRGRVHRSDQYDSFVVQHPEHAERLTGYKAGRPPMPPELCVQLPFARVVCRHALGIPVLEVAGYEADDLIGTLARRARRAGFTVRLVTADKDLFQLVEEGVSILNPHKPDAKGPAGYLLMDAKVVEKDFGVAPGKVIDLIALVGDTSDNIPGVPGIGDKGARELIGKFGSVEGALEAARDESTEIGGRYRKALVEFAPLARLSRDLATIRDDIEAPIEIDDLRSSPPDPVSSRRVFTLLAFESFLRDLQGVEAAGFPGAAGDGVAGGGATERARPAGSGKAEGRGRAAPGMEADPAQASFGFEPIGPISADPGRPYRSARAGALARDLRGRVEVGGVVDEEGDETALDEGAPDRDRGGRTEAAAASADASAAEIDSLDEGRYRILERLEELTELTPAILAAPRVVLAARTTSSEAIPARSALAGIAIAWEPGSGIYVPLAGPVPAVPAPGERGAVLQALSPIVESRERPKTGQNVKADIEALLREGLKPAGFEFDTMIAAFLLQPDRSTYAVPALAREYLGEEGPQEPTGAGRDARQRTFDDADLRRAARSAAREADVTLRLADVLDRRLAAHGLADLFRTIDMPLVDVLVSMEMTGVRIDVPLLERMSREMGGTIDTLRAEIHRLAGHEFNVDSPIQLGRVLFEEIGLKPVSRTAKSGAASTRDEDLEALAAQHPLAARVREYRTLAKLRSTYVDALPQMVDPSTGRVHTSFHPTGASTGRLSSSDPNLQNIPVRTLEGRKIRAAFVPEPGWTLISADYSQVELRVMAHMTGDPDLIEAFKRGEDIHRTTASRIFGVPYTDVTPDQRRATKTINFGILYGMGPQRLARELGIPQADAKAMIAQYFGRFPRIRSWIESTIEQAEREGHVATLFGRIRHFPDLVSTSRGSRQMAVRQAVNSRIQGTAADLMKMAMIGLHRALADAGLRARLLIQVHDELVLEAPREELPALEATIREAMENVHPLEVPLTVDVSSGPNWLEAKP